MLIGAHAVIYSTNPDADRAFLRDVIKLTNVDAGGGYVIFGLPPSEVAVHQHDKNDVHEFYLMCADVEALIEELKGHNVVCGPVQDEGWGLLTRVMLPGGGKLGIYQPRHPRPEEAGSGPQADWRSRRSSWKTPKTEQSEISGLADWVTGWDRHRQ